MARRRVLTLLYCSVSPIPFATMTNREWGQIGNNYLKSLFAIGFQGFLIMICVGIYAVLVNNMIIADNLHSAIFSLAAYTVILCFSPVSYTHLDVYKRQKLHFPCAGFASYPFVDLPPIDDCKQSSTVSKFYTSPI